MITDKLKELLTTEIVRLISTGQVGFGGNSTSPDATALDVPSGASTSINKISTDENVMEVKISVSGGESEITGQVIREAAIFDSSSNLLARVDFEGVGPFSSNDTLEIILIIEVE